MRACVPLRGGLARERRPTPSESFLGVDLYTAAIHRTNGSPIYPDIFNIPSRARTRGNGGRP
jgi:hypothetical protein